MNSLSRKHFLRLALAVVAVAAAGSAPNVLPRRISSKSLSPIRTARSSARFTRRSLRNSIRFIPTLKCGLRRRSLIMKSSRSALWPASLRAMPRCSPSRASIRFANILKWVRPTIFRSSSKRSALEGRQRLLSHDDETRQFQRQAVRGAVCYLDADCLLQRNAA